MADIDPHEPVTPIVLIVDDDLGVQRVMTKFLTREGFTAAVAGNGVEALAYLRAGSDVRVIVLDLRMPVMDGWTFRREQRLDPVLAGIPVVVLSGAEVDRLPELDAAASFRKPVSFPEIIDVVRRLCDRVPERDE
jgi:CheY-like chemotaxis protein